MGEYVFPILPNTKHLYSSELPLLLIHEWIFTKHASLLHMAKKDSSLNITLASIILKCLDCNYPECSDLKWSLWEWKVLIDLHYFSSIGVWVFLICNANLNELCEHWWNVVYYLPHQVINDFINKIDNKTVISSTLLWKMILASRSIFQGPGFSVAALSLFNIFHRQRKVKIHFETNFN